MLVGARLSRRDGVVDLCCFHCVRPCVVQLHECTEKELDKLEQAEEGIPFDKFQVCVLVANTPAPLHDASWQLMSKTCQQKVRAK